MKDKIGIFFKNGEQPIDQICQFQAEHGKRHIPFPVPMRVRNYDEFFHFCPFFVRSGKRKIPLSETNIFASIHQG